MKENAGSSNGRTAGLEPVNEGSTPSPAVKRKEYGRAWHQKNKAQRNKKIQDRNRRVRLENRDRLIAFLREHPCADCGQDNIVVLEFDHLKDKKANVTTLVRQAYSWATILKEIAKCEVVCANCHRIRTATRGNWLRV